MALYCLVQLGLFFTFGINTANEAEKYIREGESLVANGRLQEIKFIFYLPVILAIAFTKFLHIGYGPVVLLQVVFGAISLALFYKALALLTTKKYQTIGTLLLLFCIPLQKWNFYLYSDSFFYSFCTIFFSLLILYYKRELYTKLTFLLLLFPVVLLFSRPAGMFFLPVASIGFLLLLRNHLPKAIIGIAIVLPGIILFATIYFAFNINADYDAFKPFVEEHIICLVPEKNPATNLDIQTTGTQFSNLGYYILHNPVHFTKLILKRLFSFLVPYRTHYSDLHNFFLCSFFLCLYILCFINGKAFYRQQKKLFGVLFTALLLYTGGIILQCDDWSNRFTMTIVSLLLFIGVYNPANPAKK